MSNALLVITRETLLGNTLVSQDQHNINIDTRPVAQRTPESQAQFFGSKQAPNTPINSPAGSA